MGGSDSDRSGRELAIIEIKLAHNDEARRAVIAQILAYAAYLDGITVDNLHGAVLGPHLSKREWSDLADAAATAWQGPGFDPAAFRQSLADHLRDGRFRLVVVLDRARRVDPTCRVPGGEHEQSND